MTSERCQRRRQGARYTLGRSRRVDVRAFGTGERIVFLPYTREVFAATQLWTQARNLFPEQPGSPVGYDQAALV